MLRLALREKNSTLTPESTRICVQTIQIILQRPNRMKVMALICGIRSCSKGRLGMHELMMKANSIMQLYEEGER